MEVKLNELTQNFERFKAAVIRNDFDTASNLFSDLKVLVEVPDWNQVFTDPTLPLMVDIGSGGNQGGGFWFTCKLQKIDNVPFTFYSVNETHPNKLGDQISDAVLEFS